LFVIKNSIIYTESCLFGILAVLSAEQYIGTAVHQLTVSLTVKSQISITIIYLHY